MSTRDIRSEQVFAEALEVAPGEARKRLVLKLCDGDDALRNEVEELLLAHDSAGDFLCRPPQDRALRRKSSVSGSLSAAADAGTFLRDAQEPTLERVQEFLDQLPQGIRQEVRERIQAGLNVRQWLGVESGPSSESPDAFPHVPGFRVERKLGQGGVGIVYAAYDEKLKRRVAIKVLRDRGDVSERLRLLEEARHAAALGDPAVVTVFSVLEEADPPAIVMEFIEGFAVDRFSAQLSFEHKARILREVARGLSVAHAKGLLHRDLKPENVMVGPDMRPRILDFGLALSLEEACRLGPGFQGSPLYASPEQALGKPLTAASDIFSFGGLMFKVLTGKAPFMGESIREVLEAIVSTSPPFLREVALGVPEDLQAVCLACLAWNPAERPSADQIALDLGRFLVGEPVRVRPKLYDDLLRRAISEHAGQAQVWEAQGMISSKERDALESIHRSLLADEDHWIIHARRITPLQTVFTVATWLTVVATVLTVWRLRHELHAPWSWGVPAFATSSLLLAGRFARQWQENVAAATFLAGAALAIAPSTLALLAECGVLASAPAGVVQLFPGIFTNQQLLAATATALCISVFGLRRLKMTGFAWTTAVLTVATYGSALLTCNWLDKKSEVMALWCLPLGLLEFVSLRLERLGRVQWMVPFHWIALAAIVIGLDVMALNGPTLAMLGITEERWSFFHDTRQKLFSVAANGVLFLIAMLLAERAPSLNLRRTSKWLEVLGVVHTLTALYANAEANRMKPSVLYDVCIYLICALFFAALAPLQSRWRMLCGGLLGCGLGCHLLVDMGLVDAMRFILGMGALGLGVALGAFLYARRSVRSDGRFEGRTP